MKTAALQQAHLWNETIDIEPAKAVNVSSVRQLSPFRYPGGKTWLVPQLKKWLAGKSKRPEIFAEPFAGGGIISLTVAAENLADKVVMLELDPEVAAVWATIFSKDNEWLATQIVEYDLTYAGVKETLDKAPNNTKERAFQTILKNRTYHGGILAPGSGLLKSGENGKGIASRWYPETLAKRIRYLALLTEKISFFESDALQFIENNQDQKEMTLFIDPPYSAPGKGAGKRLYKFSELDHGKLFELCERFKGDFLMTYDDAESVLQMAEKSNFKVSRIPMKNTHHNEMYELLITPE